MSVRSWVVVCALSGIVGGSAARAVTEPVVSNVRVQQPSDGTKRVKVLYDLSAVPAGGARVSVVFSADFLSAPPTPAPEPRSATNGQVIRFTAFGGRITLALPQGYVVGKSVFLHVFLLESPNGASEDNTCPQCIMLTLYNSPHPGDARCACSGQGINPTLSGSACDIEVRTYGPSGYAGLGDETEACLTDGRRSILVSMEPPSSRSDPAFLLVVKSLRFDFPR